MSIQVTKEEYDRLKRELVSSEKRRQSLKKSDTNPFHQNRDPYNVRVVLRSIQRYGFRFFYFNSIKRFFAGCDGGVGLNRNHAVNVLQALEADGFICIHRNYNGHNSRYECLFDPHDIEDVYQSVVGE